MYHTIQRLEVTRGPAAALDRAAPLQASGLEGPGGFGQRKLGVELRVHLLGLAIGFLDRAVEDLDAAGENLNLPLHVHDRVAFNWGLDGGDLDADCQPNLGAPVRGVERRPPTTPTAAARAATERRMMREGTAVWLAGGQGGAE